MFLHNFGMRNPEILALRVSHERLGLSILLQHNCLNVQALTDFTEWNKSSGGTHLRGLPSAVPWSQQARIGSVFLHLYPLPQSSRFHKVGSLSFDRLFKHIILKAIWIAKNSSVDNTSVFIFADLHDLPFLIRISRIVRTAEEVFCRDMLRMRSQIGCSTCQEISDSTVIL